MKRKSTKESQFLGKFSDEIFSMFPNKKFNLERLKLLLPLHGLKWCSIILNHFLPVHQDRKSFSGLLVEICPEILESQLNLAKEKFHQIQNTENILKDFH